MSEPTVFIVDDEQQIREALELLLESVGLKVETYESSQEYLQHFDPNAPGCLILDVRMPGMSGMELQNRLAGESIHPPVIVITGHGDVPMAVEAMQAGAVDFIEKPFNDQRLLDSVHRAIELDTASRDKATRLANARKLIASLTPREKEVLDLITQGKRNKNIADELHVSQSTVEAHRSKVMEKMQASSLSELMRIVVSVESC